MRYDLTILLTAALSVGFLHTIVGPDHYIPFVAVSRARQWSLKRTIMVTMASGLGHVVSSIALGLVGIALGVGLGRVEVFDGLRGNLAGWLLIGFGLAYAAWGLRESVRAKIHDHSHPHADGRTHNHQHDHSDSHTHPHDDQKKKLTPWVLFVIFLFGPCEPLIPILMYPAATAGIGAALLVAAVFGLVTIITMIVAVVLAEKGVRLIKLGPLEKHVHTIAGVTILLSGVGVQFVGL